MVVGITMIRSARIMVLKLDCEYVDTFLFLVISHKVLNKLKIPKMFSFFLKLQHKQKNQGSVSFVFYFCD